MKKLSYIALILFSSCILEDDLNPSDIGAYSDKLVVNSLACAGESLTVQLSNSTSVSSSEYPSAVENATITITRNGVNETMVYNNFDKLYECSFVPSAGDLFQLDVRANGYLFVNSSIVIPADINATASLIENGGIDTSGLLSDLVKIDFTDQSGVKNYYKINFFYYNPTLGRYIPMIFTINDPDLAEYSGFRLNDGSMLFSDELFDGESKSLGTVAPFGTVIGNPGEKYKIELIHLSEDLYKYYNTLQNAQDAKNKDLINQFNNAVVIHSNIKNGIGIFGGCNPSIHILQ